MKHFSPQDRGPKARARWAAGRLILAFTKGPKGESIAIDPCDTECHAELIETAIRDAMRDEREDLKPEVAE